MRAEEDDSPERRELVHHKFDDEQLLKTQKKCTDYLIRLGIHDRTSATMWLKVPGVSEYKSISYRLVTQDDFCELQITTFWDSTWLEVRRSYVWALTKHHAVEAILGVRDLHLAHRIKMQEARAKREAAKANA